MSSQPNALGRLGDRLVALGKLSDEQLQVALKEQRRFHRPVGEIVVSLGFVAEEDVTRLLAEDMGLAFVAAAECEPDPLILSAVDPEFVRASGAFPYQLRDGVLKVVMLDPGDPRRVALVRERFPYRLELALTTGRDLDALTRRYLQASSCHLSDALADMESLDDPGLSVEKIADAILTDAINRHATDIHIEPEENLARLRYRIDGMLQSGESLPAAITPAIVSRFKVIAKLDVSERRRPQDGRIRISLGEQALELRVSIMPSTHGENLVLRILDSAAGGGVPRLAAMGINPHTQSILKTITQRPHGLFLVTGPTGSGKTTTLYGMLGMVDALRRNVATIEDPVEYQMPLLRQSQVDPSIGFTFHEGLRSLLRQDPDVILIGEIRDEETANMAVKASMTGHLVLSTLHTNSALGAVPRLVDIGIESYLVEDSLIGAMGQRLVRKVCGECAEERALTEEETNWFGENPPLLVRQGAGCERCNDTGLHGRTAIIELFMPDDAMAEAIRKGGSHGMLESLALESGFSPLEEDGKRLVAEGVTTMNEVMRVSASHRLSEAERGDL